MLLTNLKKLVTWLRINKLIKLKNGWRPMIPDHIRCQLIKVAKKQPLIVLRLDNPYSKSKQVLMKKVMLLKKQLALLEIFKISKVMQRFGNGLELDSVIMIACFYKRVLKTWSLPKQSLPWDFGVKLKEQNMITILSKVSKNKVRKKELNHFQKQEELVSINLFTG